MELAHNKFPVDTTVTTATINDKPTDISISKFSDKLFVIITQIGKVGNLIEIRRDIAQKDDPSSSVYNIKFLLGGHNEEIYFAARILANFIPSDQTIILGLCLKDYQQSTLRQLGDYIKSNQLFTKK